MLPTKEAHRSRLLRFTTFNTLSILVFRMNSPIRKQQSVLLALDTESGKLIEAHALLTMDEASFRELRRASLTGLKRSRKLDNEPKLRCGICNGPVHVSAKRTEFGNRWFAHHGDVTLECPYRSARRLSAEEQLAWIYQGQQEGHEHKRLKHFIADWLEKESECLDIWRDKVRHSDLKRGEWKRPDVRGLFKDKELVFEIQLSYTFLSEVVGRDSFYRQEKVHIIWIFRKFELHREVVRDELFYNRRNLFILDADAETETIKRNKLTFKCYYQTPVLSGETVSEKWSYRYLSLDDINFPEPEYRPYYRDFNQALFQLLRLRLIRNVMKWGRAMKRNNSAETANLFLLIKAAWQTLEHHGIGDRPDDFDEYDFLNFQLPRLISIKYGRPIGYRYNTIWQVLDASLQMSSSSKRPFNILYLMAVSQYKPPLKPVHAERIKLYGKVIADSIKAGNERFIRNSSFDAAIELVFPELKEKLHNKYGIK